MHINIKKATNLNDCQNNVLHNSVIEYYDNDQFPTAEKSSAISFLTLMQNDKLATLRQLPIRSLQTSRVVKRYESYYRSYHGYLKTAA
jgi:hypothetical protein